MSDIPKPVPPIVKEDMVAVEPGKTPTLAAPVPEVVSHTLESVAALIEGHMTNSKKRSRLTLAIIVCGLLLGSAAYGGYQKLVVEPKLSQAIALEQTAQKSIDDTQTMTKVLINTLAAQNPKMAAKVKTDLTNLGFNLTTGGPAK